MATAPERLSRAELEFVITEDAIEKLKAEMFAQISLLIIENYDVKATKMQRSLITKEFYVRVTATKHEIGGSSKPRKVRGVPKKQSPKR
jgi:hypothetical protein